MRRRPVTKGWWTRSVVVAMLWLLFPFNPLRATCKEIIPALIPSPQKIKWNGDHFVIRKGGPVLVQKIVDHLPNLLFNAEEGYTLKITTDTALLTATTPAGIYRGLQTVHQLTVKEKGSEYLAGCEITDYPVFRIRGFMQDVGRNYMPLSLLKEQIDVMASYKFNLFHLHLTDNPGWRLESKLYPELKEGRSMSRWPGKYYSQEEFVELVNYCAERSITLMPELDIPGHCAAFRKAFAIDSMADPRVKPILLNLIDELCALVPKEKMPYIHLGTDEVWAKNERPDPTLLAALAKQIRQNGREVFVWRPGESVEGDSESITQLWSSGGNPKPGHRYIDSKLNYLNHLDPLAGVAQLYFDPIGGKTHGDSLALGGILCCWNDNNVTQPSDILAHNPVYPGMLTYSETSWKGPYGEIGESYLAKLPTRENPLYDQFNAFENRLARHRDLYFKGKPFPYVKQSEIEWALLGPIENLDNTSLTFYPNEERLEKINVKGEDLKWFGPFYGGTIHLNHFFGYPSPIAEKGGTVYATTNIWSSIDQETGCWIGFHDWSRSGGRRGGPLPDQGKWLNTNPKVWLNGQLIPPPVWKHPGMPSKTGEIPFVDENYTLRKPVQIRLKKGWNTVLIKIPKDEKAWKWMFTFVPVTQKNGLICEVEGLKYSTNPQLQPTSFTLAPLFGEHMVFQQQKPIQLYGTATHRDTIEASFSGHRSRCVTDQNGAWKLTLPSMPAGGPYSVKIKVNGRQAIDWNDILVGEVWLCSGQSNMDFRVDQSDIRLAGMKLNNRIRLFKRAAIQPTSDMQWENTTLKKVNNRNYFEGNWCLNTEPWASQFSAIGWRFGTELQEAIGVPVGLIQVAVGGAPIESFIDQTTLRNLPTYSNLLTDWFSNDLIMQWCRERAEKNIGIANHHVQRHPFMPSYNFEAGIAPLTNFPIKGVIWYQGESNAHDAKGYSQLFPALVNSWRAWWNQPQMPFYLAQLSSIEREEWPPFREMQRELSHQMTGIGIGMVVTSDLGDSLNVHPIRKEQIGKRFAWLALRQCYGDLSKPVSPEINQVTLQANKIVITLNHCQSIKTSDGKAPCELEIADKEGIFKPVSGAISGHTLAIDCGWIKPKTIRYGWHPYSHGNLTNEAGLPLSTFEINLN